MRRGVTCRFIGRLGNNMFQAAAVIGYAKKNGVPWFIPSLNRESPGFYGFFPEFQLKNHLNNRSLQVHNCGHPNQFNFQRLPYWPTGISLHGFFQSLKYFDHCQGTIKKYFKLNTVKGYEDYVSIHVRRGDYVQHAAHFPPLTMPYISQAMAQFPDRKFLVFSDDIPWCQANIPGGEYPNGDELADLSLMASCSDHIIANSTFSWWGAYLGINPKRKIISPHHTQWFGRHNGVKKPPIDLIPDGWEQLMV